MIGGGDVLNFEGVFGCSFCYLRSLKIFEVNI